MPKGWSAKDERMYEAIKASCLLGNGRSSSTCKRIAASTVNKFRRKEGRTLSGLVDVEERAKRYPKTFRIGPEEKRTSLAPGDHAKIIWEGRKCGERPWVIVTARSGNGRVRYTGKVDNETSCGPKYGTTIHFGPENVADQIEQRPVSAPWKFLLSLVGIAGVVALGLREEKPTA